MLKITLIACFSVPGEEKMDTPPLQSKDSDDDLQRTYDISHSFIDVGTVMASVLVRSRHAEEFRSVWRINTLADHNHSLQKKIEAQSERTVSAQGTATTGNSRPRELMVGEIVATENGHYGE